jgi:hypothetical protein
MACPLYEADTTLNDLILSDGSKISHVYILSIHNQNKFSNLAIFKQINHLLHVSASMY